MYQFYYADNSDIENPQYRKSISEIFQVTAIRPTMWEEHCLECSAPLCFNTCVHYVDRGDSRCKRFVNGIYVYEQAKGCCNQGARLQFRKWANMMTIIFPAMLSIKEYNKLTRRNQVLGKLLKTIYKLPISHTARFTGIRILEYLRRKKMRKLSGVANIPDAFVFHGYSFERNSYRLILEVFDDHESKFRMSLLIEPGENLLIFDKQQLTEVCWENGYLVKIYPENDIEAKLDILWCDFVQGHRIQSEKPADKVKCVVWDLDNTVWNGTLIETENANQLQINSYVLEAMKKLDERGIIQSVASKNDYEQAWPVVEKLGVADYFLYPQIHWNAKSTSIEQIAKKLNIGIDTFALIDDSVFERNQVVSALPQVRVYDVKEISSLLDRSEFSVKITDESRNRRSMYKAEEQRNRLMVNDNSDTVSFLKKCHLSISLFEPKTEEEISRCYELVVRTNQLNMSGKKYTENEFAEVLNREGHKAFAYSCKDDFGSYGIVGFGQYRIENSVLIFTEFAMSCRVAGKYVESALFTELLNFERCKLGFFNVNMTKKNILLRRTLEESGFEILEKAENHINYNFTNALNNNQIVSVGWRKE